MLTPSGLRLPFCRSYYTRAYCQAKGKPYRTQTERAAEMIQELPLPEGAKVVVLGDTAFDAACIRQACAARRYTWVVPMNPERVLAGARGQRRKVRSLVNGLKADQLIAMRLHAGQGTFVAQRRLSPGRVGRKVKPGRIMSTPGDKRYTRWARCSWSSRQVRNRTSINGSRFRKSS